jgi:hypothetical protein
VVVPPEQRSGGAFDERQPIATAQAPKA